MRELSDKEKLERYGLYGSEPSSEYLVAFETLLQLRDLNQKFDKLLDLLTNGAVETYTAD
jgi:hypothetical protein